MLSALLPNYTCIQETSRQRVGEFQKCSRAYVADMFTSVGGICGAEQQLLECRSGYYEDDCTWAAANAVCELSIAGYELVMCHPKCPNHTESVLLFSFVQLLVTSVHCPSGGMHVHFIFDKKVIISGGRLATRACVN